MSLKTLLEKLFKVLKTQLKETDDWFIQFDKSNLNIQILDRRGTKEQAYELYPAGKKLLLNWKYHYILDNPIEYNLGSKTLVKDLVSVLRKRQSNIEPKERGKLNREIIEPVVQKLLKRYPDIKKVAFTGSLARKGAGNDVDLVIQYRQSEPDIYKVDKRIFSFGFDLHKLLNDVKIDIFLKLDPKWLSKSNKYEATNLKTIQEGFDVPSNKVREVKYLLYSIQRAGFFHGFWLNDITSKAITASNRPLSKESVQIVIDCLEYVYSFGDERFKAIRKLEQASSKWNLSKADPFLILKLPYNRVVYRWIDYVGNKLDKLVNTLKAGACYDRGRLMYSFTMHKNAQLAERYLVRDKGYGALLQYDLADMSGYAVPIVSAMRYLMKIDHVYSLAEYLIAHDNFEGINTLYNIGVIDEYDKSRHGKDAKLLPEFHHKKYVLLTTALKETMGHYLFQKEILVFSKETSKICPSNLIKVYAK